MRGEDDGCRAVARVAWQAGEDVAGVIEHGVFQADLAEALQHPARTLRLAERRRGDRDQLGLVRQRLVVRLAQELPRADERGEPRDAFDVDCRVRHAHRAFEAASCRTRAVAPRGGRPGFG